MERTTNLLMCERLTMAVSGDARAEIPASDMGVSQAALRVFDNFVQQVALWPPTASVMQSLAVESCIGSGRRLPALENAAPIDAVCEHIQKGRTAPSEVKFRDSHYPDCLEICNSFSSTLLSHFKELLERSCWHVHYNSIYFSDCAIAHNDSALTVVGDAEKGVAARM